MLGLLGSLSRPSNGCQLSLPTTQVNPSPRLIGLTGGIACGKSAVERFLTECGATVIDADQLARAVVAPGSEGLREVIAAFGPDLLLPSGALDRTALGALVFALPFPGEPPEQLALRLALAKARHIAQAYPMHVVIGADQVIGRHLVATPGSVR